MGSAISMRSKVATALIALSLAAAGCSGGTSDTSASSHASDAGRGGAIQPEGTGDFAGLVDIGGGRTIFIECAGTGSPTVVLIAGKGNGANDGWGEVLDPADPVRQAPDDQVALGKGDLQRSDTAVFASVAKFTRVCAYSRPGTGLDDPETSTPVPQPHRVGNAFSDLHAVLGAAGESGPYVLVGHSYGGLIVRLFASMYPHDVSGLVMEDVVSEFETETTTPEEFTNWDELNSTTDGTTEAVELIDAMDEIRAAPAMPDAPAVVLSSDKPPNRQAIEAQSKEFGALPTFAAWLAAHDLLAKSLHAKHITDTNSGHNIEVYQPQLVTDAIRTIVDEAR
ncbi:alpha/beta hydrolase [Rhodococcus sp. T2V]|uniref:alpha/beta fold hydrolase n=1 Tax=Rhodococcus sp. T2V TaxID=3034164 RepID=UPI0023E12186|nr:alpha/beta hydrolase [Rhodococcus sp. T2V]MDF3312905.1 alpha/beta hydrolase [Rhodococcus sp. T2V]